MILKILVLGLINLVQLSENLILIGDFNVEREKEMLDFLNIYPLKNLVKQKTCNKNPEILYA